MSSSIKKKNYKKSRVQDAKDLLDVPEWNPTEWKKFNNHKLNRLLAFFQ